MRTTRAPAALLLLALLAGFAGFAGIVGGCGTHVGPRARTHLPPSGGPARPVRPSGMQQVVADPRATLSAVSVRPVEGGYAVRAWWLLAEHGRSRGAIVSSRDGMSTATYARGTYAAWAAHEPRPVPPSPAPGLVGLLPTDVLSLRPGTRAQQGGHDGATLDPFERVVRSVDGGPWRRYDVPRTDGQQAYTSGQVVLPDGRLLVLLDQWSADRRGHANPVWHGLWVSAGDDWASYAPWHPAMAPIPAAGPQPWGPLTGLGAAADPRRPDRGIVWVTTVDRLYVSTDGARTFRELPARPAA